MHLCCPFCTWTFTLESTLAVSCGEFFGKSPDDSDIFGSSELFDLQKKGEERLNLRQGHLEGPTIIYVPTRKETVSIANFLCKFGVKAAAYNAKVNTFSTSFKSDDIFGICFILIGEGVSSMVGVSKSQFFWDISACR